MPVATTVKVAVCPAITDWLAGWVVIDGDTGGVTVPLEVLEPPPQPARFKENSVATIKATSVEAPRTRIAMNIIALCGGRRAVYIPAAGFYGHLATERVQPYKISLVTTGFSSAIFVILAMMSCISLIIRQLLERVATRQLGSPRAYSDSGRDRDRPEF